MSRRVTILPLQARTATIVSPVVKTYDAVGAVVIVNVTAKTDSPSVVFTVEGVDETSGLNTAYTLLTSAAVTSTGLTRLTVHPQLTAAANTIAKDIIPSHIRVTATHGDADSITYAVSAYLVDA
jgi:hypothetical protein